MLKREVGECAAAIESCVRRQRLTFAYEYGHYDEDAVAAAARMFSVACTTRFGIVTPPAPPGGRPRLDMYYFRDNRLLEAWGHEPIRRIPWAPPDGTSDTDGD